MRLTHSSIQPVGTPVRFRFDGRELEGIEGETLAAALSAAGIVAYRQTLSGAPRGQFCGMGACFDCVVTVDGRAGRRACLEKLVEGMVVGGAGLEPLARTPEGVDAPERIVDVLVVGAGPAGLAAGLAAAEAGASVVVLDERSAAGGQYHKPLAPSHRDSDPDGQFREGAALRGRAVSAGVEIVTGATVWGAFSADEVAAVVDGVAVTFRPKKLILAPGAHERPVPVPGWTLPGVMTTGGLQTLARAQRVAPGERIVIAGNGPLNLQLACELAAGGATVVLVVEAAARPGLRALRHLVGMARHSPGLMRQGLGYLASLRRFGVPIRWGSRAEAVLGEGRVEAVEVGGRRVECDIVALNLGFQPEVGLARALDAAHRFVDVGLGHLATVTDEVGRTSVPGVFAVGDGASLGGSRVALARGRLAGLAAVGAPVDPVVLAEVVRGLAFQDALWRVFAPPPPETIADGTIVCRCEEVTAGRLRAEVSAGLVSIAALKKATRAGMGRCQGRYCAASIARMLPQAPSEDAFAAPRVPVKPVPAAALMFEMAEFEAPLIEAPTPSRRLVPVPAVDVAERHADILVIGGGVVGLATAYYLAVEGADVMVVDRDEAGLAASTANAGSLHVQLIPYDYGYPGMPDDGGAAGHTLPLGARSVALWKAIAAEAGESLGISTQGGLALADTPETLDFLRGKVALEKRYGVETHIIGANELRSLAPHISDRMVGAVFCPAEGRIDPLRGTMALAKLAQARGARLVRGAEVSGIVREGTGFRVRTGKGDILAGRVVNCAGPYGAAIAGMVGLTLPVGGTVQQVIVTEPAPRLVEHLVAFAHRHLSLKQQDSGGLLIGGGWFGSYDARDGRTRNLRRNIQGNLWVAAQVLPALRGLSIIRSWTGINTVIDRAPIIGEAPGVPGFFNAITANGYTLGPVTGRMTADVLLREETVHPWYRAERFG